MTDDFLFSCFVCFQYDYNFMVHGTGLSKSEVLSLAKDAIDHIFASDDVKTRVLNLFAAAEKKLDMS